MAGANALARENSVTGDLLNPVIILFAHWMSGLQHVNVWSLPNQRAEAFLLISKVYSEIREEMGL